MPSQDTPHWYPLDLHEQLRMKNEAFRMAHRSRGTDFQSLQLAQRLRTVTNRRIPTEFSNQSKATVNKHKNNPAKFWAIINDLLGTSKTGKTTIHLKDNNGDEVSPDGASNFSLMYV